jgi:hypothetical protein
MQKTAAQMALFRFQKVAEGNFDANAYLEDLRQRQFLEQAIEDAEVDRMLSSPEALQEDEQSAAFADPSYESPLERKRRIQGTGSLIGSGAGMLGGAIGGSMLSKNPLLRVAGGVGGGLGGLALGSLGGWGLGSLLARARMGHDYQEE